MPEDEEQMRNDPMAMVDLALSFTAPIISARRSLLESGMSEDLVNHLILDFGHFLITSMTAQFLSGLPDDDDEPGPSVH